MQPTTELSACDLAAGYEGKLVFQQLSVTLPTGKVTAIVGANGSGKSTLLKTFARILKPLQGAAYLDGKAIHTTPTRELARRLSILPQQAQAPEALTVYELVSFGRYPHRTWLRGSTPEDHRIVCSALDMVGLAPLAEQPVATLSGGQQQRVWIAMTLAQGACCMLLDEPTSHLDICHQLEIMELLQRLNREQGKTVVMVLHDLNLAARYCDHMLALKAGRIVAAGSPAAVMTEATLKDVLDVATHVFRDPRTGTPVCIPYLLPPNPAS